MIITLNKRSMNKYICTGLVCLVLLTAACKKANDFIRDEADPTGLGSRPVSTNPLRDYNLAAHPAIDARAYPVGGEVKTELQFFSSSPVKEINLYSTISGTRTLVTKYPYAAAYSQVKRMDTLLVSYTMPARPVGTSIRLDYEILNQNALSLVRTATVRVQ